MTTSRFRFPLPNKHNKRETFGLPFIVVKICGQNSEEINVFYQLVLCLLGTLVWLGNFLLCYYELTLLFNFVCFLTYLEHPLHVTYNLFCEGLDNVNGRWVLDDKSHTEKRKKIRITTLICIDPFERHQINYF